MLQSQLGALVITRVEDQASAIRLGGSRPMPSSAGPVGTAHTGLPDPLRPQELMLFFLPRISSRVPAVRRVDTSNMALFAKNGHRCCICGRRGFDLFAHRSDLFALEMRGRVMGLIDAFSVSSVLGIPWPCDVSAGDGTHLSSVMSAVGRRVWRDDPRSTCAGRRNHLQPNPERAHELTCSPCGIQIVLSSRHSRRGSVDPGLVSCSCNS